MLKIEDKVIVKLNDEINEKDQQVLTMLYLPLIKERAYILYNLLISLQRGHAKFENHLIIQKLSGFSIERIEKERLMLEKYELLKTYYNAKENQYLYIVLPPKDGKTFLKHELFGRMYVNELGEQVTTFQKKNFISSFPQRNDFIDISTSISNILKDDWNENYENAYLKIKDDITESDRQKVVIFNYDEFLNGYNLVWPKTKRTKKQLESIGEFATLYGINEKTMRRLVSLSLDAKQNLDLELLKQKSITSKAKYETSEANIYKWPPVRFLESKQSGIPVSKSDKETIRLLLEEYRMTPEVCNVLIEYVLETSDQKFIRNFVESIAASWSRAKIDTYEKAIGRVNGNHVKNEVQDDFSKMVEDDHMSEAERQKLIEEINQMRGE